MALYLALGNSERGRKPHESVAFNLLRTEVLESLASRKVVTLDCCYSGAALEGAQPKCAGRVEGASGSAGSRPA